MAFSNYLENIVLDFAFGKIWYSPQELLLGLSRADPGDDGSGLDEPSGSDGYQQVPVHPVDWIGAHEGMVANSQTVVFPTATGNWGLIKWFVLFDVVGVIIRGELSPHQQVDAGQKPRFNPTKLEIFMD